LLGGQHLERAFIRRHVTLRTECANELVPPYLFSLKEKVINDKKLNTAKNAFILREKKGDAEKGLLLQRQYLVGRATQNLKGREDDYGRTLTIGNPVAVVVVINGDEV